MSRPALRLLFAALAVAFFFTPVALRAVGVHAHAFENRRLANPPKLSQGWDVFDQTTRFLTDRMPLREEAVRANTHLSEDVFGTTPRYDTLGRGDNALPFARGGSGSVSRPAVPPPRVMDGRDGWLFLRAATTSACSPSVPFERALAGWRELVSIVRASGRRAVMLVPPDKDSIYPDKLPASYPSKECAERGRRALWSLLDDPAAARAGVVGLREPLRQLKRHTRGLLYEPEDSHWNAVGGMELVRRAVRQVGGGVVVAPGEVVDAGQVKTVPDLPRLIGEQRTGRKPDVAIHRAPGAKRVRGRTLYLPDSFGDIVPGQLGAYFDDFHRVLIGGTPRRRLIRELQLADTVIIEAVEREFTYRVSTPGPFNAAFLRRLRASLKRRP